MDEIINLENGNDESCTIHRVKVNGMRLTIMQHEGGRVSLGIHGATPKNDITIHNTKVTKKLDSHKGHSWTSIKVVE